MRINVKLGQNPNPRAHLVLFAKNSPFKPKKVESKNVYQRQSKHRNKGENDE